MNPVLLYPITAVLLLVHFSTAVVGTLHKNTEKSTNDPSKEKWGYIEVRPGASTFYWLYYTTATMDYTKKPWVIWLIGGPGMSSTGVGNFQEIGPLDPFLKSRKYSWVSEANILFIDSPVGTGFSYVNSTKLLTTTNAQIASDLTKVTSKFLQKFPIFQTIPLFIFGESYGGKTVPEFALKLDQQIRKGNIKCNLKGVSMGDSSVSIMDSTSQFADFLYTVSLIDRTGFTKVNESAYKVQSAFDKGQFTSATNLWLELTEGLITNLTNGASWKNIFAPKDNTDQVLIDLMNGAVRKKLRIIPDNIVWAIRNNTVNTALKKEFLKPAIHVVESLLNDSNIAVNVYNGQLNCDANTMGALQWVGSMKWHGIPRWKKAQTKPISLNNETAMFVTKYRNFGFYWILKTGHMMPQDQPQTGYKLLQLITDSEN